MAFDWQTAFAKLKASKMNKTSSKTTNYAPVPPSPFIKEVTLQGRVTIGFSSDV